TPTTSCPCSFRSHAATEESTPPDRPTTTRRRFVTSLRSAARYAPASCEIAERGDAVERHPPPGEVVVDAAHHQRRAMAREARAHLGGRHPQRAHDAVVERTRGLLHARRRGEREAQVRAPAVGRLPQVDADEPRHLDAPRAFLERLADRARLERLAGLEMARRLVEAQAATRALLDEQETPVALDDRRDAHRGALPRDRGHRFSNEKGRAAPCLLRQPDVAMLTAWRPSASRCRPPGCPSSAAPSWSRCRPSTPRRSPRPAWRWSRRCWRSRPCWSTRAPSPAFPSSTSSPSRASCSW